MSAVGSSATVIGIEGGPHHQAGLQESRSGEGCEGVQHKTSWYGMSMLSSPVTLRLPEFVSSLFSLMTTRSPQEPQNHYLLAIFS